MVIYAAVVLAVAVVLARLAPKHETLLLLALVPILAAHRTDPNAYLYEDAAPRKAALADTERLPAVVLNKAGYEVAPDLFLEEFAKREAVDQASGKDDAASLRAAVESRDLHDGFLLYATFTTPTSCVPGRGYAGRGKNRACDRRGTVPGVLY